jgi:hypothetical protein
MESDGESEALKNKREKEASAHTKKSGSKARDEYNEKFRCIFAI